MVLADEIHCDFVTKGQKYTPFAIAPEQGRREQQHHLQGREQVVRPGRDKVAWFYTTNADYLARIKVNHRAELNTLGIVANQGAYTPEGEEWLNQVVEYIDGNHDFAADYIAATSR